MSHQEDEKPIMVENTIVNEEKQETYTPKMKPGDVEIPNRVFVKGFPKETIADELFTRFEEFGKVIECRIVADRYGNSKGFGFVTFDSQNVAETVRDMERVKFNEDCEVVIGPARIRKKRFYLLPGSTGWNIPQPCYFQDGNIIVPAPMPPGQVVQAPPPHMMQNVQMSPVSPQLPQPQTPQTPQQQQQQQQQQQTPPQQTPPQQQQQQQQQQAYACPVSQQSPQQQYAGPVILSVLNPNDPMNMGPSGPINMMQQPPQPQYYTYQACSAPAQLAPIMEKMTLNHPVTSPIRTCDDQEVPSYSPNMMAQYGIQFQRVRSGTF